ncbi:hypothetical protein [Mycobacterium sp. TY815]|uniref:hypothetical protein n=1 Tax=Mycobacterium sp. TY815 TaxID=3050581 RepID=UPI00274049E4|nr:hypothetical protein [Mycobacterium sp. TY815]MDP7707453.1 hypothetical protein [Mycobacterium sp. TY815]
MGIESSYTGTQLTPADALGAAIAATRKHQNRLPESQRCRYTIHVDGALVALISAGVEKSGEPGNHEIANLLAALGTPPIPQAMDP